MILYFCDKKLNVYGCMSNQLPNSPIESDQLTKDIDSTVATLELTIDYTAQTRAELEQWTMPGCYILMRYDDGKDYVFQIIDAELDTGNMAIEVTAEDAGLELLNVECLIYPDEEQGDTKDPQTLTWYVSKWIKGSGFEIGVNESSSTDKKALTFDSEQTATERLKEVASKFEMEVDYSFAIEGLKITHKYVNIHKKIGTDNGVRLYAGRNLSSITVKRSIENLATCLLVYGSTPDGGLGPLTLDGYVYNDGNYYVDGHYVKSKTAVEKWGVITRTFEYDTTDQQTLLSEAIKELKTRADVEVNYEVDVVDAPENIHVGDTVGIVDDAGGLYLSARILKMERSIIDHSTKLTIGNYLIKTAGLSATVQDMAKTFQIMKSSTKVVSDVQQMYCLSDSVDSSSGGTWTTQMPELMDDQHYLWTKTVVSYTDGYTSETTPVLAAAINGAANTATRYVTAQTESGQILVHPEGDTKNAVLIGQDVQIIRNGTVVATYSDDVRIGKADSAHAGITESGMAVYSAGGADKVAEFGDRVKIGGTENYIELIPNPSGSEDSLTICTAGKYIAIKADGDDVYNTITGKHLEFSVGDNLTEEPYNISIDSHGAGILGIEILGALKASGRITSGKESTEIALSNGASGSIYLHRKGDIASVYITGAKLGAGTVNRTIATVPEGWRPVRQTAIPIDG
ncbi:MAG TPA: hypothetical protein DCZ61_09720, partial [Lachnospiraceae bacterium]|nr:hypothetical protein [Lachnospiraceae bacterium]